MRSKAALLLTCLTGLALIAAFFVTAVYSQRSSNFEEGQPLELLNQLGGVVAGMAQSGNYAYVGVGPRLTVIDVQDPSQPSLIGQTEVLPGIVGDVVFSGMHAFAIAGGDMLVIDVSNPANPTHVGTFDPEGSAARLVISSSLVYVAESQFFDGSQFVGGGLRIVDVSSPTNPSEVGYLDTNGTIADVTLSGSYAYIVGSFSGAVRLAVVDVSNPASPSIVGTENLDASPSGITTNGSHLFVALSDEGLEIYDISTPTNPGYVSQFPTPGTPLAVAVDGNMVYLADYSGGLRYIDVSNPAVPADAGAYDLPGPPGAVNVAMGDSHVYLAYYLLGLHILGPSGPILTGIYDEPIGWASFVQSYDEVAFIHDLPDGLRIMDITNGVNPVDVGSYITGAGFQDMEIVGNQAYFAGGSGLVILDVSTITTPTLTGSYNSPGSSTWGVAVSGSHAFLADHSNGLEIVDISNPALPTMASNFDTAGTAYDLSLSGNHIYLADSVSDLMIIDVSDPLSPTLTATYPLTNSARLVDVAGQYAYITDHLEGLHIVDISDPHNPAPVGFFPLEWDFRDLKVAEGFVYLAGLTEGIAVIDVNDPANPTVYGTYQLPDVAVGVEVHGSEIYAAVGGAGLYILRGPAALLADNDSPTVLGQMTTFTATVFESGTFTFSWNFGDGNDGSGAVTSHTYAASGGYTAVVVASSMTDTFTATTSVIVDEPVSGLSADNDSPTALGSPTNLTASTTAGSNVVYSWNFGDGSNGSGSNTNHTYGAPGVYTATVKARNSVSMDTAETVVVVEEAINGLTASNDGPTTVGDPTTLMASITAGSNVSYVWSFGDGMTGSGQMVMHTYDQTGMYTAVVTATNAVSTQVAMTTVTVEEVPETEFLIFLPAVLGKPQ